MIDSHIAYIVSYLLAMIGKRSTTAKLTIAIEAGFQSFPTAMLLIQLTCPQPESMLSYPIVMVYLFNLIGSTLVGFTIVVVQHVRKWRSSEPPIVEISHDVSPSIADTYSISKAASQEKFGSANDLGMRSGSFVSLTDKF